MEIFVERLNALLNDNGVSKNSLAKSLGVSKGTITFWCNGTNEPKISYLKKIAKFFEVSSDYLLGLENEDGTKAE